MTLSKSEFFATLPDPWGIDPLPEIQATIKQLNQKVVVLDDDPTGTQTVHDVTVVTAWTDQAIQTEMEDPSSAVFVMHNSRSMTTPDAEQVNADIGAALAKVKGRPFVVLSRSDSTLRGHFPAETDALAKALNLNIDAVLIIPAFMAGGRFTIHDVHYVAEGDLLTPASDTPFAQDKVFGYQHSNLREWVQEKTQGVVKADDVASISLDTIRNGGPDAVHQQLMAMGNQTVCVVNATNEVDLGVVALGALKAESDGKRLLYRTAASFATIRAGIDLQPPLDADQLDLPAEGGGLIVVGSYVPKTTSQLNVLLERDDIYALEADVNLLTQDDTQSSEVARIMDEANRMLTQGATVVIYTSRELVSGNDAESSLSIGNRVSNSLVTIVRGIHAPLRYVIAKGGITSSDVATKGLDVQRAFVPGQVLPGIPIWKLGAESRKPDMIYVVFPGNVGDNQALSTVVDKLNA